MPEKKKLTLTPGEQLEWFIAVIINVGFSIKMPF
jgi:hypothetical protein